MWSLASRLEPLCKHELADYASDRDQLAVLFCALWPKRQATPKMHKLLYHVLEQLVELRSCGMLHEGVVEAVHVVDNRMILRFGCVQNLEQQVRCRLRAIWQQQDPSGAPRIRERESAQQDVKRRRLNTER
eukprot:3712459-Prymnesium_polylepis.1